MKRQTEDLIRENIKNIKPYSSAREEFTGRAEIYLDANESPFYTGFNRYPDPLQKKVKEKLAEIKGVKPEQIFLSNGSDEAIDWLVRAFCEPKEDSIVICPPTFGMYEVVANINLVTVVEIPLTIDFQPDVKGIIQTQAKILFLCSPNNPTGNQIKREVVLELIEKFDGLVVVDEAYVDFSSYSLVGEINKYPNLVVLQTFSKAWGMAGLRLGATYGTEKLIHYLTKLKMPYNVGTYTQKTALKLLTENKVSETAYELLIERKRLEQELPKIKQVIKIFPSDANFLLVQFDKAKEIYNSLAKKGILIRNQTNKLNCENCLRITVGTKQENDQLLSELNKLV